MTDPNYNKILNGFFREIRKRSNSKDMWFYLQRCTKSVRNYIVIQTEGLEGCYLKSILEKKNYENILIFNKSYKK